jgi:glycosyltransferase involved in cell wall biosynthesis
MRYIHRVNNTYCIFHNTEDLELFVAKKIINRERCVRTMGSGIDLNVFAFKDEPSCDRLKVLFTARMIEEKGVLVLIDAANKLRSKYSGRVQFLLCGGLDTNPLAITKERLEQLCDGDYIQWLGRRNDVRELLEQCHIFAFPSYYKEGLPKSCIEASAIGRPIITCDSVGCRDTVVDGQTGYLVPKKDSDALAERLAKLLDDADLRRKMGRNARAYAEKMFSVEDVVKEHHRVYKDLI